jgi:hypothetical protein
MLVLMMALLCASGLLVGGVVWISGTAMQMEHEASAHRLAALFETSLHSAMLRRDLPGLTETLIHLGSLPGVHFAALLNPSGEVRFASREGDRGQQHPEWVRGLCLSAGCTASPPRLDALETGATGLLRIAYPIRNQARCSGCHGTTETHPVNGVLVLEFTPPRTRAGPSSRHVACSPGPDGPRRAGAGHLVGRPARSAGAGGSTGGRCRGGCRR